MLSLTQSFLSWGKQLVLQKGDFRPLNIVHCPETGIKYTVGRRGAFQHYYTIAKENINKKNTNCWKVKCFNKNDVLILYKRVK